MPYGAKFGGRRKGTPNKATVAKLERAKIVEQVAGEVAKEIGQAMATLECLAENIGLSADAECEREFARVKGIPKDEWTRRHDAKVALQIANLSDGHT